MTDISMLLDPIRTVHEAVRDHVVRNFERFADGDAARAVVTEEGGDTIYGIDRLSEELLVDLFERQIARFAPLILIAEGIGRGKIVLPKEASEEEAVWRIIVDPIDGTRGLMYQKRSGWILTGVAPNRGEETRLSDIQLAVQTEIPLIKQHLSDVLWALRGQGAHGERFNRLTRRRTSLRLHPSAAANLDHGFSTITRFFSGARDLLAAIDDEIMHSLTRKRGRSKALCFEDQYISTAGQLYELIVGHDRFIADLRPLVQGTMRDRGLEPGLCCHPYDLAAELIAREAGVSITDILGKPLQARLCVEEDVSWVGYANLELRSRVEPVLQAVLRKRSLIPA